MRLLWRRLPPRQRYPLPPREIVEQILPERLRAHAGEDARRELTMAAHFGYGAATGALLPLLTRSRRLDVGAAYGVGIWAVSYLGWIPAFGILQPATRHPARRNALMIAVHLLWGGATALALAELQRAGRDPFGGGPPLDVGRQPAATRSLPRRRRPRA